MAKVKFDASAAAGRLKKEIDKTISQKEVETDIGILLTDRVRFEARKGRPLNRSRSFPALKALTVQQRRYLAKFNRTNQSYAAKKSNLTFSGQYLDALSFKRKRRGIFELFIKDSKRTPYRTGPNSRAKKTPNNAELDKFLRKLGFVLFDEAGLKSDTKITGRIKQILLRFLRRRLGRS